MTLLAQRLRLAASGRARVHGGPSAANGCAQQTSSWTELQYQQQCLQEAQIPTEVVVDGVQADVKRRGVQAAPLHGSCDFPFTTEQLQPVQAAARETLQLRCSQDR